MTPILNPIQTRATTSAIHSHPGLTSNHQNMVMEKRQTTEAYKRPKRQNKSASNIAPTVFAGLKYTALWVAINGKRGKKSEQNAGAHIVATICPLAEGEKFMSLIIRERKGEKVNKDAMK